MSERDESHFLLALMNWLIHIQICYFHSNISLCSLEGSILHRSIFINIVWVNNFCIYNNISELFCIRLYIAVTWNYNTNVNAEFMFQIHRVYIYTCMFFIIIALMVYWITFRRNLKRCKHDIRPLPVIKLIVARIKTCSLFKLDIVDKGFML